MRDCMPKISSLVFMLSLAMVWPTLALGSVVVSLNNEGSTTQHEITVNPGDIFNVDLGFTGDEQVASLLMQIRASVDEVLTLSGGTAESSWVAAPETPHAGLDPVSGAFGFYLASGSAVGPGSYRVALLQMGVRPSAVPGVYSLSLDSIQFSHQMPNPVEPLAGSPGPDFIVEVLPEPTTGVLVLAAGLMLSLARP